jgi:hypothetical protein
MVNFTNINKRNNDIGNSYPGVGQAHKCGRVKAVNGIQTLSWILSMATYSTSTCTYHHYSMIILTPVYSYK